MSKLLPVGSIVSVDDDKPIEMMITGYYPVNADTNICYRYLGVVFPGGVSKDGIFHMFQEEDIRKVIFEGFSTPESVKSLGELQERTEALLNQAKSETDNESSTPEEQDLFF